MARRPGPRSAPVPRLLRSAGVVVLVGVAVKTTRSGGSALILSESDGVALTPTAAGQLRRPARAPGRGAIDIIYHSGYCSK